MYLYPLIAGTAFSSRDGSYWACPLVLKEGRTTQNAKECLHSD